MFLFLGFFWGRLPFVFSTTHISQQDPPFTKSTCVPLLLSTLFLCPSWPWRLPSSASATTPRLLSVRPALLDLRCYIEPKSHDQLPFSDDLSAEFAHVLEQLETQFYAQALKAFQASDFTTAGFNNPQLVVDQLTFIANDEATHTTVLEVRLLPLCPEIVRRFLC